MVLTKGGMISESRNIVIEMEVVPLSIHVIDLFIKGKLYSALSIQMIFMAEIIAQYQF